MTITPHTKHFIIQRSELEGRWDASFNYHLRKGQLKSAFESRRISKICTSVSGGTPSKEKPEYWNGRIPWASPKDIKSFYLTKTLDFITQQGVQKSSTKVIEPNNLLIVFRALKEDEINCSLTTVPTAINQDLKALYFIEDIIPEYILILFKVFEKRIFPLITKLGTTVYSINTTEFEKLKVPIPPKETQQKIVNLYQTAYTSKLQKEQESKQLLDSIDAYLLNELGITIPQKDNSLESRMFTVNFSEVSGDRIDPIFFSNRFSFLFTSKFKYQKLSSLCNNFNSGFGIGRQDQVDKGVIQIRPTNLGEFGELRFEKNVFVPSSYLSRQPLLSKSEVIFNNTNSQILVGKSSIWEDQFEKAFYSNHITAIKVSHNHLYPYYLMEILNLYQSHMLFYSICTNWNNQSGIGLDLLRKLKIPIPPPDKQTEIANHISDLRTRAKQLQQEAIEILNQAKATIEKMILN